MIKNIIKKLKHHPLFRRIAAICTHAILRFLIATCRVKITNPQKKQLNEIEALFCAWHQNILSLSAFLFKNNSKIHCVVSPSEDGKFLGDITEKIGLRVLYGSSHKEPITLVRNALKILKNEKQLLLIGDGSRGPAKQLQPGISYLANKSNKPIIFVDIHVSRKIVLKKTWDKFQVPLPFSKITVTLREQHCLSK